MIFMSQDTKLPSYFNLQGTQEHNADILNNVHQNVYYTTDDKYHLFIIKSSGSVSYIKSCKNEAHLKVYFILLIRIFTAC